jgi:oligogalacturonide lyase
MITHKSLLAPRALLAVAALSLSAGIPAFAQAPDAGPPPAPATPPPKSWIDPDTGHRVLRITNEPGSDSFYFNYNAFTPDGKEMVYTTPDGISVLNLTTFEARQVVSAPNRAAHTIIVGHKTPTIYYTETTKSNDPTKPDDRDYSTVWATNVDTGETRKLVDLPRRASVVTINADETLGCGSFLEGDAAGPGAYGGRRSGATGMGALNMGEPLNKGQMMAQRLAAKLPITMFTVDLQTGKVNVLIQHSTDWLNHMQFSPTDPNLLLFCHEGLWWLVDRIWTMHTDGTLPQLVHKRTMENEIAGHEWWGMDGKTVYYQLHFPRGLESSFIASYNEDTGERIWYHYKMDESSIHDNSSPDGKMFCGDGDNRSPWIVLFRPVLNKNLNTLGSDLVKTGYLQSEKLVNMQKTAIHAAHNYRLEPNPAFTPDQKYIIFRSNMFGPDYAFAVEVAKATAN